MSVRALAGINLLILCAGTTGCGTSAERKAEAERSASERNTIVEGAAPEQKPADREAAAAKASARAAAERKLMDEANKRRTQLIDEFMGRKPSKSAETTGDPSLADSIKVKVEVELRGVLCCAGDAATISIDEEHKWVLDFGADKEIRAKAKGLDGKTVLLKGNATLRGIRSTTSVPYAGAANARDVVVRSYLDLEPKVAVKSLVAVTEK
jgi:hypothetical protein